MTKLISFIIFIEIMPMSLFSGSAGGVCGYDNNFWISLYRYIPLGNYIDTPVAAAVNALAEISHITDLTGNESCPNLTDNTMAIHCRES